MESQTEFKHSDLVKQCQVGNSVAQYKLYKLYVDAMFNTSIRLVTIKEDAEDVVQDSFVEAFKKIKTFRFESTFGAWLKRIVINKSINHLKAKKVVLTPMDFLEEVVEENCSPKQPFNIQKIKKGIQLLPVGYKQILTLYLIEGYDHGEIAKILDVSISTSKSQYHRAKKKLIQIVNEL